MHDFSPHLSNLIAHHLYLFLGLFIAIVIGISLVAEGKFKPNANILTLPFKTPVSVSLLVLVFAVIWGVVVLSHADFTSQDAIFFFTSVIKGQTQWVEPPIWPDAGRFFPLGQQEFFFLSKISQTILCYNLFIVAEFAATLWLVASFVRANALSALTLFAVLSTSAAVVQTLIWLIYPEKNIVFLFALMLLGAARYLDTQSRFALAITMAAASLQLFLKETGFILVGAVAPLVLLQISKQSLNDRTRRLAVLGVGFASIVVLWGIVYGLAIFPQIVVPYNQPLHNVNQLHLIAVYFKVAWPYVLIAAVLVRLTLLKHVPINALWDALPLAAFVHAASIVTLRFQDPYYVEPSVFTTYLYAWMVLMHFKRRWLVLATLVCVLVQLRETMPFTESLKESMAARSDAITYIGTHSKNEIRLHTWKDKQYGSWLFGGLLQARYDVPMMLSIDGDPDWTSDQKCTRDYAQICSANHPVKPGDFVVSFGDPVPDAPWPLVHTTPKIGFWHNHYHVYIYQAGGVTP